LEAFMKWALWFTFNKDKHPTLGGWSYVFLQDPESASDGTVDEPASKVGVRKGV
jgi:hypothetical protein